MTRIARYLFFAFLLVVAARPVVAQTNTILSPGIASLQVVADGDWLSMPVITLGGDGVVSVGFDDLTHEYRRYAYSVRHCEADWAVSDALFASDYCEGFADGNVIDDVQESVNTTVLYTHYGFSIPNDKCRLTKSGNYRVSVYDDNTNDTVLTACFMVCEPAVSVMLGVTTNTEFDVNGKKQQVEMSVKYNQLPVADYQKEIKTVVLQNGFWHSAVRNVRPQLINTSGLGWTIHCRDFVFDGGNEYRKFETLDPTHTTMGLESVGWDGRRYHANVWPDEPRPNYVYDEDANGAFIIRNSDNVENDIASDYVLTHFTLVSPRMPGDVYIMGKWTNESLSDAYRMEYDEQAGHYTATLSLKQGYYSYRYLTESGGSLKLLPSDGNFYQTENEYEALVYFRGRNDRTDRLVGYATVRKKQ